MVLILKSRYFISALFVIFAFMTIYLGIKNTYRNAFQVFMVLPYMIAFFLGFCGRYNKYPFIVLLVSVSFFIISIGNIFFISSLPELKIVLRTLVFVILLSSVPVLWSCVSEKNLVYAMRLYSYAVVVMILIYLFFNFSNQGIRLSAGHNPNELALILISSIPWLLFGFNRVSAFFLIIIFVIIIMTMSRTFLIGGIVMLTTWALLEKRLKLRYFFFFLGGMLIVAFMFFIFNSYFIEYFLRSGSIFRRFYCWKNALAIWELNPLTGVGLGMHGEFMKGRIEGFIPPYGQCLINSHNEFLALLADVGVLGVLVWSLVLIIGFYFMWCRRNYDRISRMALVVFAGYIVVGMGEVVFLSGHMFWFFVLLLVLRHFNINKTNNCSLNSKVMLKSFQKLA